VALIKSKRPDSFKNQHTKTFQMNDINIYLIRHGESEVNILPDMIGQDPDTKLTKNGEEQAAKLGKRFTNTHFDRVFSSTYLRALYTSTIFIKNLKNYPEEIMYSDKIVEYNPGDWKGKKRSEIYANAKNMKDITYLHMGFLFPNGESFHQVERRATTFLEQHIIYNKAVLAEAEKKELNIALFSHGMTIKTILHHIMGFDGSFMWKLKIDNTSVCHLIFGDRGWFLNSINDTGHLL
jgi:broad specificity phosphatase PhoE